MDEYQSLEKETAGLIASETIEELKAENARLLAQLAEAEARARVGNLNAYEEILEQLAEAEAKVEKMRPYLSHKDKCARRYKENCDCGFVEALK